MGCRGRPDDVEVCNYDVRCPRDCTWGDWGAWSQCSKTCGQGGTRSKSRVKTIAEIGGGSCNGQPNETENCNESSCCTSKVSQGNCAMIGKECWCYHQSGYGNEVCGYPSNYDGRYYSLARDSSHSYTE